jgi:ribosome-associated heat shock protein Hsp15
MPYRQNGEIFTKWTEIYCGCIDNLQHYQHQPSMTVDSVRIDKWLWAARFFKTRSLATAAVENGKVRLNGARTKPAHSVKAGDLLQISTAAAEWELTVLALAEVRGSATLAQALYRETESSSLKRQQIVALNRLYREPALALKGRPTKRDRRRLDRTGD